MPVITLNPHDCYFYRCKQCNGLLTILEERAAFVNGNLCGCGSVNYSPSDLHWYDWARPKVWRVAALKLIGGFDDSRCESYR